MEQRKINKLILRDSLIVIPTLIFSVAWLFMELNPNIEIYPGANYGLSVFLNLLLPLAIIAIAQIIYAVVLMIECIQLQNKTKREKLLLCIGVWFAVMYLLFAVYIYRLVYLIRIKTSKAEDIYELPELIKSIRPDYKLYLRHYHLLDMAESVLYAV